MKIDKGVGLSCILTQSTNQGFFQFCECVGLRCRLTQPTNQGFLQFSEGID